LIHVVLDTNIFRNNPDRSNLNFRALEKLAKANSVKLHIPYVVEREFQTQQREIYSKDVDKSLSGLAGLVRKQLSPELLEKVNFLKKELENVKESILFDAEHQLVKWGQDINAVRHPLCLEQALNALEAYFQGKPPLKAIKVREDIPDSFVVRAIENISKDNGDIHVVAGDKKVQDSFDGNDKITVYKSLSEFIETDSIQNELKDIDVLENLEKLEGAIIAFESEYGEISCAISSHIGEKLLYETISDPSIPDDNHEASIISYYEPEDINLDFSDISYYGSGSFGVPFTLKILVGAIYYIFKADYYCMDHDNAPSVTDHNDHYFEAEDEFEIEVKGIATISIDRDKIDFDEFSECVDFGSFGIDSIENIELC
jgi:hypothetical protein